MNIKVTSYLNFSGSSEDLQPLMADFADALTKHGYGVDSPGGAIKAILTLEETGFDPSEDANARVHRILDAAIIAVIPASKDVVNQVKEEYDNRESESRDTESDS